MDNDVFFAAKETAKKALLDMLKACIENPHFDLFTFATLLSQSDGGENGGNPLHSCFSQSLVSKANQYLIAYNLVEHSLSENQIIFIDANNEESSETETIEPELKEQDKFNE